MDMERGVAVHCHVSAISKIISMSSLMVYLFSLLYVVVICVVVIYKVVAYLVLIHSHHLD